MTHDEGKGIRIDVMTDDIEPVLLRMETGGHMNVVVSVRPDRDSSVTGKPRPGGINVGAVGALNKKQMNRFILMMQIGQGIYENGCRVTKEMVDELKEGGVEFKFYGDSEPK
jgi:hypothetical protein